MKKNTNENGAWNNLRKRLEEEQGYPKVYLFKFIVPNNKDSIIQLENIFGNEAQIKVRESKNGKYSSFSIKEMMLNTHSIIEKYEQVMKIEGCIAL